MKELAVYITSERLYKFFRSAGFLIILASGFLLFYYFVQIFYFRQLIAYFDVCESNCDQLSQGFVGFHRAELPKNVYYSSALASLFSKFLFSLALLFIGLALFNFPNRLFFIMGEFDLGVEIEEKLSQLSVEPKEEKEISPKPKKKRKKRK